MAIRELVPFDRGPHPMRGARPLATLWPAQALLALLVALGVTAAAIVAAGRLGNPWAPLVVAALLAPFVALVFGHVRRVLLALVIITIPTGPDIFLGYRYDIGGLGGIGGWNVSVGSLALVGLYAIWLAAGLTGIGHAPRVLLRPALPLLAYLAVNLLSVIVAGEPILSLIELFWLLQLSLLFLYVASNATTRQEVLFVIAAIMGALVLESLIMIAVGVTGQTLEFAGISTRLTTTSVQAGGFTRVAGTVGSPNAAAAYVAFLLAPALGLAVSRVPNKLRWLGAIAFGLGTLALVLTLSRGGMLAFAISLLVFGLISLRRKWLTPSMAVAAIGIVTIVALVFRETLAGRLFGSDHGAAFARIPLMQIAFNIIADHPLGIGLNNSARILPTYVGPDLANAFIYSVHNYYLTIWSEISLLGLLAFLWFLGAAIRRAWRGANDLGPDLSPLAAGVMAALLGESVHMFVDVFKGWAQIDSLLLIAGLLVAMSRLPAPAPPRRGTAGALVPGWIPHPPVREMVG